MNTEGKKTYQAPKGTVYQINTIPINEDTLYTDHTDSPENQTEIVKFKRQEEFTPIINSLFCEKLSSSNMGIIAEDAFIFCLTKHPKKNIFAFFKKNVGDVLFSPDEIGKENISFYPIQQWMENTEEDALAELKDRENDPTSEIEEIILETLLNLENLSHTQTNKKETETYTV